MTSDTGDGFRDPTPTGKDLYQTACRSFGTAPCQRILEQLDSLELSLKYRHLGPERVRALAIGLMVCFSIQTCYFHQETMPMDNLCKYETTDMFLHTRLKP